MAKMKIAITLEDTAVKQLDHLVGEGLFPNRSRAIQQALAEKLLRLKKTRLARECAKLNAAEEQAWAEIGMAQDAREWPEY